MKEGGVATLPSAFGLWNSEMLVKFEKLEGEGNTYIPGHENTRGIPRSPGERGESRERRQRSTGTSRGMGGRKGRKGRRGVASPREKRRRRHFGRFVSCP